MGAKFRTNKRTCEGCGGKCCTYVCMELDEPKKYGDYDDDDYTYRFANTIPDKTITFTWLLLN